MSAYVCIYSYMYVRVNVCVYKQVCINARMFIFIIYVCMYVCMRVCIYASMDE